MDLIYGILQLQTAFIRSLVSLLCPDMIQANIAIMDVSFDDVEITDDTTLDLQSSSWAFLKAHFM